jgi:hypothetical protein
MVTEGLYIFPHVIFRGVKRQDTAFETIYVHFNIMIGQ